MRIDLPSPATLGLSRPTAAQDLQDLGWDTDEALPLVLCIASAGDPDLALNTMVRIYAALEDKEKKRLTKSLIDDEEMRVRLIVHIIGSIMLVYQCVTNPRLL